MSLATELNSIKSRVKAECARRKYTGSVEAYAGTAYDYSYAPASGIRVREEHYEKNAIPLNVINSGRIATTDGARIVEATDLNAMKSFLTTLESRVYSDKNGTDCAASCTGMCYSCTGTCGGGCSGCSGSCQGGCSSTCTGACANACASCNACGGTCGGGCKGTCRGGCTGGCTYYGGI